MTYLVPAVLAGLALTVVALVSITSARRARRKARKPTAAPAARFLVHAINDDRCTGCDACVAVCPTNVLDLVENKSRVLRFQDCIQCEACMWACPTEALVMHPQGTEPPNIKQPELDDFYQTAIPGQYLIGEVAGKPLVKNAANLGRAVVEHMIADGLMRLPGGAEGSEPNVPLIDVAIVGSGPGGLSTALTCIHHHLSYILFEKENIIASTVARYPKGKLIMAEPYEGANLSFLPVFDSSKEEIIPIWQELIERVGLQLHMGEGVDSVVKRPDGMFDIHTSRGQYRAQRVVLSTGLRGKPRNLGVKGEELPKVFNLLEDPTEWRGKSVCVVGGGDSALEAAVALADAGARVVLSYRGRAFSRAQPKNRTIAEAYEAQKRIKIKYQSDVIEFAETTVTLRMIDGTMKRYPNEGSFVLIGADPPIAWLSQLGINYVERPHMHALRAPHDLIKRLAHDRAVACPEDAARAAALALGRDIAEVLAQRPVQVESRPKKWLRSATNLFTGAGKLDKPMPLSEFAAQSRKHSGRGRRDQLPPGERTRILRMLRDEGGRLADEDSQIYLVAAPPGVAAPQGLAPQGVRPSGQSSGRMPLPLHDDAIRPPPSYAAAPPQTIDIGQMTRAQLAALPNLPPLGAAAQGAPKQAVIVGLARAAAEKRRKRATPRGIPPTDRPAPAFIDAQTQHESELPPHIRGFGPPPPAPVPSPSRSTFPVEIDDEQTSLAQFDPVAMMADARDDEQTGRRDIGSQFVNGRVDLEMPPEHLRTLDSVFASDGRKATRIAPSGATPRRLPPPPFGQDPTRPVNVGALPEEGRRRAPVATPDGEEPRVTTLSDVEFDLD